MRFFQKFAIFLVSLFTIGAGPILVDTEKTGLGAVWQRATVRFDPESGEGNNLGKLSNENARELLREMFQDWQEVTLNGIPVVSFSVVEGDGIGSVDDSNLNDHFSYCPPDKSCPDEGSPFVLGSAGGGLSPIIFDADGEITDLIHGVGAKESIIGFAGPRVVDYVDGVYSITEGQAVLNGLFIDCAAGAASDDPCQSPEVTLDQFEGAIFHEIGHLLGLDHTQVNLSSAVKALSGDASEVDGVPTMFPLLIDGAAQRSPHFDDIVSIASLYPARDFSSSFCDLEGTVYLADGTEELQGVNVIARRLDNPRTEATSFVSGQLFVGDTSSCDNDAGGFVIRGLTPGVKYEVLIEKISGAFTGGSSIEPCDPPQSGFQAETIPGTFSCSVGGETVRIGSQSTTSIVTSKGATSTTQESSSTGGCSLIPE